MLLMGSQDMPELFVMSLADHGSHEGFGSAACRRRRAHVPRNISAERAGPSLTPHWPPTLPPARPRAKAGCCHGASDVIMLSLVVHTDICFVCPRRLIVSSPPHHPLLRFPQPKHAAHGAPQRHCCRCEHAAPCMSCHATASGGAWKHLSARAHAPRHADPRLSRVYLMPRSHGVDGCECFETSSGVRRTSMMITLIAYQILFLPAGPPGKQCGSACCSSSQTCTGSGSSKTCCAIPPPMPSHTVATTLLHGLVRQSLCAARA